MQGLVKKYQKTLLNQAKSFSHFWADDIVQEVWIKVWDKWDLYELSSPDIPDIVRLKRMCKTKSIDYLRKNKPREYDLPEDLEEAIISDFTIDIERLDLKSVLKDVIYSIPDPKKKFIAINRFLKDMSYKEIMEELSLLGYKDVQRKSLYVYTSKLKDQILLKVRNYRKKGATLEYEIDFELGDN